MPIWDYRCNKCGKDLKDHMVAGIKEVVVCECGEVMERQFNLKPWIKRDREIPLYMPPPEHICKNPQEYYRD